METKTSFNFPLMEAQDIECRVGNFKQDGTGFSLLLYKNARVDMRVLDDILGVYGWQRQHQDLKGVMYCGVSIKNPETGEWLTKWDAGKESRTEAEKGEASDSFKRACVNWGLGRELYTAPFIWINAQAGEVYTKNGSLQLSANVKFYVTEIAYNNRREITHLVICDNNNVKRYEYNDGKSKTTTSKIKAEQPQSTQQTDLPEEKLKSIQEATNIIQSCKTINELRTFSAGLKKSNPDLWAIVERTATEKSKQFK